MKNEYFCLGQGVARSQQRSWLGRQWAS